jgi:hypothetical protein
MQALERHRLALTRKERTNARDRLCISTGADRGERVSYDRKLARLDRLRAFARLGFVGHVERKQIAVELEERRLAHGVADVAVVIERGACHLGHRALGLARGRIGAQRLALSFHRFGCRPEPREPWIEVGHYPALEAQGMKGFLHLAGKSVCSRLHERLGEQLVAALVELRDRRDGLEGLFIRALEAVQALDDVLEPVLDELDTYSTRLPSRSSWIFMPYRPGGSDSTDFSTDTICACSFFATLPETKIPRCPTSHAAARRSPGRAP